MRILLIFSHPLPVVSAAGIAKIRLGPRFDDLRGDASPRHSHDDKVDRFLVCHLVNFRCGFALGDHLSNPQSGFGPVRENSHHFVVDVRVQVLLEFMNVEYQQLIAKGYSR